MTATFRPRTVLGEADRIGEVRALSFSPEGRRLATGGVDGSLRLWDVNQGIQVGIGVPQDKTPINTLAFSPDGRFIVVGHEGGGLFRFDAANLGQAAPARLPTAPDQGPVESLAYSPDGRLLAVGIKSDRADSIEPMAIACDLEIRAMPAGDIQHRRRVSGLVHAWHSALGETVWLTRAERPSRFSSKTRPTWNSPQAAEGTGQHSLRPGLLGRQPGRRVHSRAVSIPTRPPPVYDGFDLGRRKSPSHRRDELRLAIKAFERMVARRIDSPLRPGAGQPERPTNCDSTSIAATERNWWSYTMIPPGPGPRAADRGGRL